MGLDCFLYQKVHGPDKDYPEENNGEYHYKELWYSRKFYLVHDYFANKIEEDDNCAYIPVDTEDIQALTNLLVIDGMLNHEILEYRQEELSNLIAILTNMDSLDDIYYMGWY